MRFLSTCAILALCSVGVVQAQTPAAAEAKAEASKTAASPNLDIIKAAAPGANIQVLAESPIKGLYAVSIEGDLLYINEDGKLMIQGGKMIDLVNRKDLSSELLSGVRLEMIKDFPESKMIIFTPPKETPVKHKITVFTDIDCGYCRKLQSEIDEYLAEGIEVRYMAFPRSGPRGPSYDKAVSVWCSKDPKKAMDEAKKGVEIEMTTCENPVAEEYQLGNKMGVNGTPAIFTADGTLMPGYVPAKSLAAQLDAMATSKETVKK